MTFKRNKFIFILWAIVVLIIAGLFLVKYSLPDINEDSAELRKDRFNYSVMKNITILLGQYKRRNGRLPSSESGLVAVYKLTGVSRIADAWGRGFHYSLEPNGVDYKLWTYGRDGQSGGESEAKDLYFEAQ